MRASASEAHIGAVGGDTVAVSATFARPANTTAYAANDEVSNNATQASAAPMTFAGCARVNAGSGYVTKVRLFTDNKTVTNGTFRLWLFNATPTMVGDNAAYALLYAERAAHVGYVDLTLQTEDGTASTGAQAIDATVRIPFVCAAASTALYGILLAKGAYTPASGQNLYVELTLERN